MAILYQNEPKIWNGGSARGLAHREGMGQNMVYFLGGVRLLHTHSPREVHQNFLLRFLGS